MKHPITILALTLTLCASARTPWQPPLVSVTSVHRELVALPAYWYERPGHADPPNLVEQGAQRSARLWPVAEAITAAANARLSQWPPLRVAGILVQLGQSETGFARYVGEGRCAEGKFNCDPHPITGEPQSLTYWQVRERVCPDVWAQSQGSIAELKLAAVCAARRFIGAYHTCAARGDNAMAGAFAGYRSVGITLCKGYEKRAAGAAALEWRLGT